MADLLWLVPTRGRPANARRVAEAFDATSTGAASILFAVDGDRANEAAYAQATGGRIRTGPWRGLCATLNHHIGRELHAYRAVGFGGDDHVFRTPGWDRAFLEALERTGVVYGNDLLQGQKIPTACAMSSDIPEALGYFAPPPLRHLCVDLAWLEWGRVSHLTYLPDTVIEHLHPGNGKAPDDEHYRRVNAPYAAEADARTWDAYLRIQFPEDERKIRALSLCGPAGHHRSS